MLDQMSGKTSVGKGFVSGALVRLSQSIAGLRSPAPNPAVTATISGLNGLRRRRRRRALLIAPRGLIACLLLAAAVLAALPIADFLMRWSGLNLRPRDRRKTLHSALWRARTTSRREPP